MTANRGEGRGRSGTFGRRLLLAVDAKGYGAADAVTQRQFQEAISRLVDAAADEAELHRADWRTQEGGDSVFAVLPESACEPALIDRFMPALHRGLRAFNQNRIPQARLRLRAAVHFGPASPGANGFVGRAPVEIGRILDSRTLRAALAEAPDTCLAVAVSAGVFDDVVRGMHTSMSPEEFRHAHVEEKEYRGEAWIWVPDAGARQPQDPVVPPGGRDQAVVRSRVEADAVAGEVTGVRMEDALIRVESDTKVGRVERGATVVGVDIRGAGGTR
ncbi:hypothetical protein [Streptomyces sp. NPDC102462]|uniref:hypothetical protein n=1 Tax=Streptomyces sp. NPDC102462 TaxID=3366178 RepID=UPI003817A4DD